MKKIFEDVIQNKNVLMFAIVIAYILGLVAYFSSNIYLLPVIFTLFIIFLIWKKFPFKIALLWLFSFYFAFFNASLRIKDSDTLFQYAPCEATILGQIVSIPNSNSSNKSKFFFNADKITFNDKKSINLSNKILVNLKNIDDKSAISGLLIGDYYQIKGKIRKPFKVSNPSQFSYAKYLRNFGVYTICYADRNDVVKLNKKHSLKWKFIQKLNTKRNDILISHSKYLKSPYLEILGGVVFGDDAVAPPDYIKATFINSGLLHILAASGMNVAFISGFLLFFLTKFRVPYNIKIISAILVIILYALMTGLGASVIRAALMLIFILVGKLFDRDANSIALLAFVALLMLIYNPAYLNDVGFQLSFIVTFGILVSADIVFEYTSKIPKWLSGAVAIPVIAQVWVIPIQMFYFNTISLYSVFANVVSVPFLSVISFGGFVSSVFSLCPLIADFVCRIFDFVLKPFLYVLVIISSFFAKLPHALFITTHPCLLQLLGYYVLLGLLLVLLKIKFQNKKLFVSTVVLSCILLVSAFVKFPNHNLELISFDVGNADAFLLKTPQNKYFIIDTAKTGYDGGRSTADIIILKYLKDVGIKNIEGIIVTHFDDDHAGGTLDLIKKLHVKKLYVNNLYSHKFLAKKIYSTVDKNKFTTLYKPNNNEVIYSEKNLKIKIFKNCYDDVFTGNDNENSLITYVENDKMKILFMGDAGSMAFSLLKEYLPSNINVFKVGHHGARNVVDEDMMKYLNPQVSLVSVGENRYGHPHPLTIGQLATSTVVRTDKLNSIKIISDNKKYKVYSFKPEKNKYVRFYEIKFD